MFINEDFFDDENIDILDDINDISSDDANKEYTTEIRISLWLQHAKYSIPYDLDTMITKYCMSIYRKLVYALDNLCFITEHSEPIIQFYDRDADETVKTHKNIKYYTTRDIFMGHQNGAFEIRFKINHNIHTAKQAIKFAKIISNITQKYYMYIVCGSGYLIHNIFDENEMDSYDKLSNFDKWCQLLNINDYEMYLRNVSNSLLNEFELLANNATHELEYRDYKMTRKISQTNQEFFDSLNNIGWNHIKCGALKFPLYRLAIADDKKNTDMCKDIANIVAQQPSNIRVGYYSGSKRGDRKVGILFSIENIYHYDNQPVMFYIKYEADFLTAYRNMVHLNDYTDMIVLFTPLYLLKQNLETVVKEFYKILFTIIIDPYEIKELIKRIKASLK